jgi:hypothetical protein
MFNLLAAAGAAEIVNWPLEILKMVAPAVLILLGLWVWHRQKRSESRYESLGYLNQKRLEGLMKTWSLMAYITDVENPKAVMSWEKKGNQTVYYLRPEKVHEYMDKLTELFYEDGYGLFFGREVKKLLYEYRSNLYGVLLKDKSEQGGSERIKLQNDEFVRRMKEIYKELNAELREELKKIEK